MRRVLAPLAAVTLLALAGCGNQREPVASDPAADAGPPPQNAVAPSQPVTGFGTVLDDGSGPELCLGGVADSFPPQCGGIPLDGWDWSRQSIGVEQGGKVRWGLFAVTGTYDGDRLAVDSAIPGALYDPAAPPDDFWPAVPSTPCPMPDGGWKVVDPAHTGDEAMSDVQAAAERLDGYALLWVDQPGLTDGRPVTEPESEAPDEAWSAQILNVAVTGDTGAAERALREVWGGPLCVSKATHDAAELAKVQQGLEKVPGLLTVSTGLDRVDLAVTYDDGSLQRWADTTYGEGLVHVHSALR